MQDCELYCSTVGITKVDMVRVLKKVFPGFSKSVASIVSRPLKYGACLAPAAEAVLVENFGQGPGLTISEEKKRSHGNKNKPNRLCLRVSDELRSQIEKLYIGMCFATMQDFLEAALVEFVNNHSQEGRAA